jgi:N-acetylglucosaminyldiphosphoundecaprenol N-acetyl-beta-D-mannosaminyltransferase
MQKTAPICRLEDIPTVEIEALPFASLDSGGVLDVVFGALSEGRGGWLVTANVDFTQRAADSREVAALYRKASLIVADGMPLVWASRLMGRPVPERVTGSDLSWELAARAAEEGRSVYLLGGAGESGERAGRALEERYPGIRIAGVDSPRVDAQPTEAQVDAVLASIGSSAPDLLFVALGSPKQEYLIDALRPHLPSTWMVGVGITLSFIAGDIARAPSVLGALGLEWVHRLAQEPGRLAERYLRRNLPYAARLLFRSALRRA